MAKITFVEACGREHVVDIQAGFTLMEGAIWNDVPGIEATCGGSCSCATCHVYVDDAWRDRLHPQSDMERDLLAGNDKARPDSRLSCQIRVTPALDGMVLRLPESQD